MAAIPLLREDGMTGRIRITTEMLETKEILMNPVNCRVSAYFVSNLCDPRFKGSREELDKSYMGEGSLMNGTVIPFVENVAAGAHGSNPILKALGKHAKAGTQINSGYTRYYNVLWNFRAKNRSLKLTERLLTDTSLAPAFWQHSQFQHVVPDFDQAVIDGKVALNILNSRIPVRGIGIDNDAFTNSSSRAANVMYQTPMDGVSNAPAVASAAAIGSHAANDIFVEIKNGAAAIFAEMQEAGLEFSLADIELAKKARAFANFRKHFEGHDDEYVIDMLMQGLSIPDQHLKQPILIADKTVRFSQAKRYSTTAGELDDSAVSGVAGIDLALRVPRNSVGGVVFVIMEILPEQLWERQPDWYLHSRPKDGRPAHDFWPDAERDTLDPEKVDIVYNGDFDVSHSNPTGIGGFGPMNGLYDRPLFHAGGKFFRPTADTPTDTARQRLWAVEGSDPTLTDDFYICTSIHTKPFLDEVSDPFELTAMGNCVIDGNTQFGGMLIEQTGNYDAVMAHAPVERIEKE